MQAAAPHSEGLPAVPAALSQRAYARHRGVSHTAVQKAIRDGRIPQRADGLVDVAAADRAWSSTPLLTAAAAATSAYGDARTETEIFRGRMARLEYERAAGRLVDRAEVERAAADAGATIQNRVLAVPARLAEQLAAMTDGRAIAALLRDELRRALTVTPADVLEGAAAELAHEDRAA